MHSTSQTPTVICLLGQTATGKTKLAIELTKHLPCEIISVDSGMVYRGMDIGTAKPTAAELASAPHRLINICDPTEPYSAGRFRVDALQAIEEILAQNKVPLLVGGTMLYFRVLQQGLSALPQADAEVRAKLKAEIANDGLKNLYARLTKIDPATAARIQSNDAQRIQRALEIYELTRKTPTAMYATAPTIPPPYKFINIALAHQEKSVLHERISERFDAMLHQGLIDEVATLSKLPGMNIDLPSMRAVGYRQVWQYLAGKIDQPEMRRQAITATRQLAKRQMTWLRRWPDLNWVDCTNPNLIAKVLEIIYIRPV